ncbi:hypothetical protein D3C87_1898200 [compost metagenome]
MATVALFVNRFRQRVLADTCLTQKKKGEIFVHHFSDKFDVLQHRRILSRTAGERAGGFPRLRLGAARAWPVIHNRNLGFTPLPLQQNHINGLITD